MLIAGDFLSPSVASSVFKGEQMIAALNAAGLDVATLGNHEFDLGADVLLQRMAESTFQYVVANIIDTKTGKPVGGASPYVVKTVGTMKVGILGLCLITSEISADRLGSLKLLDPMESAAKYIPEIKAQGVDALVALTHLSFAEDRALVTRFPEIDVVVGGHEHTPITAVEGRTLISKAGSDARWVAKIDLKPRADKVIERFFELVPVTATIPDEAKTAGVVKSFEDRLSAELDKVVGSSKVPLDAETPHIRAGETNLGNLFADAMRGEVGADIAIMNSGSVRGDRTYPAGPISRRTVVAMHPFGGVICKVAVPGSTVLAALESGVSKMPGNAGQFPQVSGLTMTVTPSAAKGQRVSNVRVGGAPLDPARVYTVAITDYTLKGGDDYTMFVGVPVQVGAESGPLLIGAVERYISSRGEIAPVTEQRIVIKP